MQAKSIKLTPEQSQLIKQFANDVGLAAEKLEESKVAFDAANRAIDDQKAALEQANAEVKQIGESFIQMALSGEASFKTMVDAILSEFIRMESRILSSKLFGSGSGGGGLIGSLLGSLFGGGGSGISGAFANLLPGGSGRVGGGRHSGGQVDAFKPIMVGEGGRSELFIPGAPGRIVSASQIDRMGRGGGGGGTVVNIYAPPGSQVEETRSSSGGTEQINVFIDNATAQNITRPGSATFRALTSGHGTRQQLVQR